MLCGWEKTSCPQVFSNNWLGKQQKKLWDTFDKPTSSNAAKVISRKYFRSISWLQLVGFLSMFAIFISTVILTLDTLPYFQVFVFVYIFLLHSYSVIIEASFFGWSASRSEYQRWSFFSTARGRWDGRDLPTICDHRSRLHGLVHPRVLRQVSLKP